MVIMVLMGIIPTIIISCVLVSSYEKRAVMNRSEAIASCGRIIGTKIAESGYLKGESDESFDTEIHAVTDIYGGRVRILNDARCVVKDTYNIETGQFLFTEEVEDCFKGIEDKVYTRSESRVSIYLPVFEPGTKEVTGCVLVSCSTLDIQQSRAILARQSAIITGLFAVIILIVGFMVSGILVQPFKKLTNAINSVSPGFSEEPVYAPEYVESDQIAVAFNHMVSQVKTMDDSREEFVSNVSHELKTPLASMKVLADSLNSNPDATLEMYKEFMVDISEEIDRENIIIGDLMELIKTDGDSNDLKIESCDIKALLELVVKRLQPIADEAGITLYLECFRPVTAEVDSTKFILIISNLVENAIKYGRAEDGWVRISLNADKSFFYISVADNGIGMSEDVKAHIFERFYRGDKSHSKDIKGTGLGLAIARAGISAHKGAVSVESKPEEGTTFSVRFPLVYVA